MKSFRGIYFLAALMLSQGALAADEVLRDPFALTLHLDKERYYQQKIEKIPYVYKDNVFLFKGDKFGANLNLKDGTVGPVSYVPASEKADITFEFTQDIENDGTAKMKLVMMNATGKRLYMNALMVVPGVKGVQKTSIYPLEPGILGIEIWPHAIVQLVLTKISTESIAQ